jgi:malonyl CoA-acyl carrier protein transacylase
MKKSRACYEVLPTTIGNQFGRSNVDAADKPEHNHNDQNQTENAAESRPAIPIIAMVATEAAQQQKHQDND